MLTNVTLHYECKYSVDAHQLFTLIASEIPNINYTIVIAHYHVGLIWMKGGKIHNSTGNELTITRHIAGPEYEVIFDILSIG